MAYIALSIMAVFPCSLCCLCRAIMLAHCRLVTNPRALACRLTTLLTHASSSIIRPSLTPSNIPPVTLLQLNCNDVISSTTPLLCRTFLSLCSSSLIPSLTKYPRSLACTNTTPLHTASLLSSFSLFMIFE